MKKLLTSAAVSAALGMAAAPASAVVVSGINFADIGPGLHIETTTLAEQFINPLTTAPGTGAGQGYGVVSTVNGASNYCSPAPCTLYYIVNFGGGTFTSPTQIEFTTTDITLYKSNAAPVNLLLQDSPTNLATISTFTELATLSGHGNIGAPATSAATVNASFGLFGGPILSFIGLGLLDVNTGDGVGDAAFEAFLDGNLVPDAAGGFADMSYNESANNLVLNPFDIANGFADNCNAESATVPPGTPQTGAWCFQGTLNTRGIGTVPEPGSLALLSVALMAAGFVARRRNV